MGQMLAGLGGPPDAFVFADAIGEDEPVVRSRACEAFDFLGVEIDPDKNAESPMDSGHARDVPRGTTHGVKGSPRFVCDDRIVHSH